MIFAGEFREQARAAHAFAVGEGLGGFGPAIYGQLASYGRDAWVFQSTIARDVGCKVRTVQRWLADFRARGWLQCWRGKKGETPPNASGPISCGWSHRALTLWHTAKAYFKQRAEELAAKYAAKRAQYARGVGMTAEQLDREVLRRFGPPKPPPD